MRALTWLTVLCLLSLGSPALAEDELRPIPDFKISIVSLLVGRINPLGLEEQLRIGPQKLLYRSDAAALRDNFVFFGFTPKLNPAFVKLGPSLEIQPLSVLNLRFAAEVITWFGSFNYFQSFQSPLADYSDSTLADNNDHKDLVYRTTGAHFIFEPLFQIKLGPVALRNRFSIEYWAMSTRPGDTVFYEPTLDTLIPANGWVLSNDLDLLYITKFRFVIGARYSTVQPLYNNSDFLSGETPVNMNGHHRLGPLLAYTFFDYTYRKSFNKPTLVLIVNWYLSHRFRTGADVNQGIPYGVLAFAFVSDLIP